ncbi:uncharacterized protein MONBRDRAFT_7595 [Monosiga brevicollis MX1]|uniref:Uncharacterized protein n=1 Tax=Monosiga brevicollis TaxID=81824 RepID=A9UXQ7_MONBE|nr:uncharacterized protein MONBRDRAFT_7595 [Monosiga brevicollis MX1]EDQ89730.1 predicted protein [Monosiga brevicollis MX1]|eukprot:XP_001745152.1 hypothetical protein [Monosiga brevicollis MX1]
MAAHSDVPSDLADLHDDLIGWSHLHSTLDLGLDDPIPPTDLLASLGAPPPHAPSQSMSAVGGPSAEDEAVGDIIRTLENALTASVDAFPAAPLPTPYESTATSPISSRSQSPTMKRRAFDMRRDEKALFDSLAAIAESPLEDASASLHHPNPATEAPFASAVSVAETFADDANLADTGRSRPRKPARRHVRSLSTLGTSVSAATQPATPLGSPNQATQRRRSSATGMKRSKSCGNLSASNSQDSSTSKRELHNNSERQRRLVRIRFALCMGNGDDMAARAAG